MNMKLKKITGEILTLLGFIGIFWTAPESFGMRLLWTIISALLMVAGCKMMDKSGAFKED